MVRSAAAASFRRDSIRSLPRAARRWFGTYLLGWSVLIAVLGVWPAVDADLSARLGVPPLVQSAPDWLLRKATLMALFWAGAVLSAATYCACWHEGSGRGRRTLVLFLALVHAATVTRVADRLYEGRRWAAVAADQRNERERWAASVASGDYFEQQWPNLQRLQLIQLPPARLSSAYAELGFLSAELRTFDDFHAYVTDLYAERRHELNTRWGCEDERKLKAMFFMNFVSGLWAFGNRTETDRPGCVGCNEETGWVKDRPADLPAYLASGIACCIDYAYLLKSLLDHEGIQNRLTCIPGHCFNEVYLDGHWIMLDASTNLCLDRSWDDLYGSVNGAGPVRVLVFPHTGLREENSPRYRPFAGNFRLLMLTRFANRPLSLRVTYHPRLPAAFAD